MSKDKEPKEKEAEENPVATIDAEDRPETDADGQPDNPVLPDATAADVTDATNASEPTDSKAPLETIPPRPPRRVPLFGIFNFLLIIGLIVVAVYYWQLQQESASEHSQTISRIDQLLSNKVDRSNINSALAPIKSEVAKIVENVGQLQQQQQELLAASEKLYELFGRDESSWKLAEIDYLMRIAQHKLILENDFEGAALALQAASDKIAFTADPGLLPVRVKISEEIAILKTRTRPDLVGMTLLLAQLGQQIYSLKPGFNPVPQQTDGNLESSAQPPPQSLSMLDRINAFMSSLVSIKRQQSPPTRTESRVVDISETLADNLKLTRWAVLERDAYQFSSLMKNNLNLFKQYYNLDDATNNDFLRQLEHLQKSDIRPEKPIISGSMDMLREIISRRENAPKPAAAGDNNNV
jgi:uroporphyrin-3 C-methyltransferase